MARPIKEGLDYFPLDVNADYDDKFQVIEGLHGAVGFATVIKILMKIYSNSYYYKWTEQERILMAKRIGIESNSLKNIVDDCIKYGLFDEELLNKYEILSSNGIQIRYFTAVGKRKKGEVFKEYLLISEEELGELCPNMTLKNIIHGKTKQGNEVNQGKTKVIQGETGVNQKNSTQSKGKESKVNKSKAEESSSKEKNASGGDSEISKNVFVAWEELWMFPNLIQKEILIELSETFSDELVVAAIKIAGSKDVIKGRAINFIEAVLREWEDNNVENIEQAREYQRNRNKQRKSYNNKPSVNKEPLPDWANKDSDTSKDDELVEDNETENRLDRLRRLREEKGIENEIN